MAIIKHFYPPTSLKRFKYWGGFKTSTFSLQNHEKVVRNADSIIH